MAGDYAFQPETVEVLAAAFDRSWRFVSADPRAAPHDVLRRRLAAYLLQLAADGEDDALQLCNRAIGRLCDEGWQFPAAAAVDVGLRSGLFSALP